MSLDINLTYKIDGNEIDVFDANITHNLTEMAKKSGVYYSLWRPEEKKYKYAKDLIKILEKGLKKLLKNPLEFKKYNPDNGWGTYEGLVELVKNYLENCKKYPNAEITVSR